MRTSREVLSTTTNEGDKIHPPQGFAATGQRVASRYRNPPENSGSTPAGTLRELLQPPSTAKEGSVAASRGGDCQGGPTPSGEEEGGNSKKQLPPWLSVVGTQDWEDERGCTPGRATSPVKQGEATRPLPNWLLDDTADSAER